MEITSLFVWRWCFGELFTYLGPYIFMSLIFPIKKGCKWKMWLFGYGCIVLYLLILFGFKINPYAEGVALRLLVSLPGYVVIPMLFIEKDGWKYVSFGITNSFLTSYLIDACIMPHVVVPLQYPGDNNEQINISYSVYTSKDFTVYFYVWCMATLLVYLLQIPVYIFLKKRKKAWTIFSYTSVVVSVTYFTILMLTAVGLNPACQVSALIFAAGNTIAVISCICYGMYKQRKENLLETEVLKMQQQLQEIQAEELLESQTKTRKLRHDLAGHMETLHMLVESGKMDTAKEYVEKVLEEYR